MNISINLIEDFANYARNIMAANGFKHISDDQNVIINQYCVLLQRRIPPHKREIKKSGEFECPNKFRAGLKLLENAILTGDNLLPWQSKNILNLGYSDELHRRWGIHHLHLGERRETDSPFMERTGKVLYCQLDMQFARFIQILDHGVRHTSELVSILARNWPVRAEKVRVNQAASDINSESIGLLNLLHTYENQVREKIDSHIRQIKRITNEQPDNIEFHLIIEPSQGIAYVEESNSKVRFKLGPI